MDDRQSAMLWQLMQSLGAHTEDIQPEHTTGPEPLEHSLLSLRPLMSPKQQLVIDMVIKMQEMKALLDEIHSLC